jgi:hypothetical protein
MSAVPFRGFIMLQNYITDGLRGCGCGGVSSLFFLPQYPCDNL